MASDGGSRKFCDVCTKHVHDLSAMTEPTARAVLADEGAKGRVCVRYTLDGDGHIAFLRETVEAPSLWRMTLAAAGLAMAFLTGCTDTEPDQVNRDECVYEVGPWSFETARGEGTCPAIEPQPEVVIMGAVPAQIEPPEPPQPIHEMKGDIAPVPPPPMMGEPMMEDPPRPPEPVVNEIKGKVAAPEPVGQKMMGAAMVDSDNSVGEPCDPLEGPRRL